MLRLSSSTVNCRMKRQRNETAVLQRHCVVVSRQSLVASIFGTSSSKLMSRIYSIPLIDKARQDDTTVVSSKYFVKKIKTIIVTNCHYLSLKELVCVGSLHTRCSFASRRRCSSLSINDNHSGHPDLACRSSRRV